MFVIVLFFLVTLLRPTLSLNIALHAQVHPSERIVGSVITTNGLRNAFIDRNNVLKSIQSTVTVSNIEIFYPYSYYQLESFVWDLVLIEGWFPSIDDFIWRSRQLNPAVIVLFICLDPSYPSLETTMNLDVDGYLTNSKLLSQQTLSAIAPTEYMALATDPLAMSYKGQLSSIENEINANGESLAVPRKWDFVYIGAGGDMLTIKPNLYNLLLAAANVGKLAIYGFRWDTIPILNQYWQGILPQGNISEIYSTANFILASTIQSQVDYGMVNNRIFEALSCEGLIIADSYYEELYQLAGEVIHFIPSAADTLPALEGYLSSLLTQLPQLQYKRSLAREVILKQHTWSHRVMQIESFYNELVASKQSQKLPPSSRRRNMYRMAWIVSDRLLATPDYQDYIAVEILQRINKEYVTHVFSYSDWVAAVTVGNATVAVSDYDVLLGVAYATDVLDGYLQSLERVVHSKGSHRIQRRMVYYVGMEVEEDPLSQPPLDSKRLNDFYDVILTKNPNHHNILAARGMEIDPFRHQHLFGIFHSQPPSQQRSVTHTSSEATAVNVVLCSRSSRQYCSYEHYKLLSSRQSSHQSIFLLLGGSFRDWEEVLVQFPYPLISQVYHIHTTAAYGFIQQLQVNQIYYLNTNDSAAAADDIYPFMLAAQCSRNIHILHPNTAYSPYLNHGLENWDHRYVSLAVEYSFIRSWGFGISLSGVSTTQLFPSDLPVDSCLQFHLRQSNTFVFQLKFEYFNPGYDGGCCLLLKNATVAVGCIIRNFPFIAIQLPSQLSPAATLPSLTLGLKGNIVGDYFYNHSIAVSEYDRSDQLQHQGEEGATVTPCTDILYTFDLRRRETV